MILKQASFVSQESVKNLKKKIQARIQENKNHARIPRKKESVKNTRTQESCLARHFLPRQPRLCLHGSCQRDQICFFRQEYYIEGMVKRILTDNQANQESRKIDDKNVD